jgi:hypothetical protein
VVGINGVTACQVCRKVLDRHTNLFGEEEWVHSRLWEETPDHDPVPVPSHTIDTDFICDYCDAPNPTWQHFGPDVFQTGNGQYDNFAVCEVCNQLVRFGNVEGLLRRWRQSEAARHCSGVHLVLQDQKEDRVRAFARGVTHRVPVPDPTNPPRLAASQLPQVRNRLARFWEGEVALRSLAKTANSEGLTLPGIDFHAEEYFQLTLPGVSREGGKQFCDRMAIGVRAAEMYWFSAEFTALTLRAGRRMEDLSLAQEDMPASHGLMYFDTPITELTVESLLVQIQVVTWILVPRGVWITAYGLTDQVFSGNPYMREIFGFLCPWGPGAGLSYVGKHDAKLAPNTTTILAAWAIMNQERFATSTIVHGAKRSAKRAKRRGAPSPELVASDDVRVVDIRRRERTPAEEAASFAATGRKIDYQMERQGHWKMQPYGAARAQRKRIWIDSYWVGDEGAPVRFKGETVHRLR